MSSSGRWNLFSLELFVVVGRGCKMCVIIFVDIEVKSDINHGGSHYGVE